MTLRSIWVLTGSNSHHNRVAYFGRSNRVELEVAREELEAMSCSRMAFLLGAALVRLSGIVDGVEEAGVEGGGVG